MSKYSYVSIITGVITAIIVLIIVSTLNNQEVKVEQFDVDNVDDIEFDRETDLFSYDDTVRFNTKKGIFIYPEKRISYHETDDKGLSIEITSHKYKKTKVKMYIGEDFIKDIRTKYVEEYESNIKITTP